EEAERKAKEEAERKAKEGAKKKEALRAAMRGDVSGVAGLEGGNADRNQAGGGGNDSGYGALVRNCVRPRVVYNVPPRQGSSNPTVQYRDTLTANGEPTDVQIRR